MGGAPFEILALGEANGQEIDHFAQPISITVEYDPDKIHGDESMLTLFYYDVNEQTWIPMDTYPDMQNHQLSAVTDHLTLFNYKAQNWESARLPSLQAFQVSQFSGSSSYSFPISVPPGPGGLQPSISLSYNSQTADSAASRSQASWVGLGWSLDGGYIQRNQNGTPNYYGSEYAATVGMDDDYKTTGSGTTFTGTDGDDTFSLVVNGQSWTLYRVPDTDNNEDTIDYHTSDESYWRVRRFHSHGDVGGYNGDTSYWVAWDKTGNSFYFQDRVHYPAYPDGCSSIFMQTWQWSLTKSRNIFGKEITYSYYSTFAA
jgi:hypothetical protein